MQVTKSYTTAIKAKYPNAQIMGPDISSWCAMNYLGDGCNAGTEASAHSSMSFTEWYLKQIGDYYSANGVKLVDVWDMHCEFLCSYWSISS